MSPFLCLFARLRLSPCPCSSLPADINAVIYGLIVLFYEPEPTDPLNLEAAAMMRDDRPTFEALVKSTLRGGAVRVPKKGGGHEVVEFKRVL